MAVNNVTLIGNAVNPDLKTSAKGMKYMNFGLAVYTGQDQDKNPTTSWFDVVCFGETAENLFTSIAGEKSVRVIVNGKMGIEQYTKNDGSESKSAKIVADEVGISTKSATAIVNKIFKGDAANVPGVQKGFQSETPVGRDMSEINTDPDSGEALEAPF